MTEHTKSVVQMAVTKSAILETKEYQEYAEAAGADNAITMSLSALGMNLDTLHSINGLVRSLQNAEELYFDTVYTGYTRADFKEKNQYENLSVLVAQKPPADAKIYHLSEINFDQVYDEDVPEIRRVKTPKFRPESEK